jgi:ribokinase
MTGRVCVVGSANLDLIAKSERLPAPGETVEGHSYLEAPGGKGLNQAIAAARAGAIVTFVGAVGDDDAGRTLRSVAVDAGLDTTHLEVTSSLPTGRALIAVGDSGQNLIVVVPGANTRVNGLAVVGATEAIANADVVLVQQEIPDDGIYAALRIAKRAGATTILNPAPARPPAPALLAFADIVVPNEHEVESLGDVSAVKVLVVTEGERGCTVRSPDGSYRVAPFEVDAVDSVASGDAFCGVLAASLSMGEPLALALERASAGGAIAATRHGAVPSLPTAAEIDALISRGRARSNHR